jgi:uncharacterized protein YbjT (DUF2867 family)
VLLVGATGLIGREVIACRREKTGLHLMGLARREMPLPRGQHMEMLLAPVNEWGQAIAAIQPDTVICALGTTKAKSGRAGLREIDVELVLKVAEAAWQAEARQFVLISSVGADLHSRSHYLAMKGEAEARLRHLRFGRLDILRPGLLRGTRTGERRVAERIGQLASPAANALLHGSYRRYRSINAADVAAAALQAARERANGVFEHEYDAIRRLAARLPR